jgi:hypothetical protein
MLRSSLAPVRRSLLTSLGLAALACGPTSGVTDDDGTAAPGSSGPGATDDPTAAPTTAGPTSSTGVGGSDDTGAAGCAGPVEVLMQGFTDPPAPSGFVRCEGGIIHREEAVTCLVPAPPSPCDETSVGCQSNDDCKDIPFGSCQPDPDIGGLLPAAACSCRAGCETDADCPEGQICRCGGPGLGVSSTCIAAACATDADCGGFLCGLSSYACQDPGLRVDCTTPDDECSGSLECGLPCNFDATLDPPRWHCDGTVCGRPHLVDDVASLADVVPRADWLAPADPAAPPAPVRARLADAWAALARMEHASVAAFARVALELLAVGAPVALVADTHRALADELEHARLCFGLASAYAGAPLGPGPLPAGAPARDLAAVVVATVREACVCETLSALEAREAAARAGDPAVRAVWTRIAADEQRHAELGWRTLQWALAADPTLAPAARAAFATAVAEATRGAARDAAAPPDLALRAHGLLDAPLRAAVWRRGLAGLIAPCAARLLAA